MEFKNNDKAIRYYEESIKIFRHYLFKDGKVVIPEEKDDGLELNNQHKEMADNFYNLGYVHMKQESHKSHNLALCSYKDALKLYWALLGNEDLNVARVQCSISLVLAKEGSYEKAMVFFKECLRVRTFHKGEDDVEVARVFLAIGLLYEKKWQCVEALVNLEECLRIRKTKMGDARGKLEVTQTLQNMGIILGNSRDYKQSC